MSIDILEKLEESGIDFSYGELENFWLNYYINNYFACKERFKESLHNLREACRVKSTPVIVGRFIKPREDNIDGMLEMYSSINKLIEDNTNENWFFSHVQTIEEDCNTDPYSDFEDMREVLYIYACVEDDKQPTTYDQEQALHTLEMCKRDLDEAKENLEREISAHGK